MNKNELNNKLDLYLSDEIHSKIDLNALNIINLNSIGGVNDKFPTEVTNYDISKMLPLFNAMYDFSDNVESKDILGHGCYLLFIPRTVDIENYFNIDDFTPKLQYEQNTLSFDNEVGSVGSFRLILTDNTNDGDAIYSYALSLKTFELFMDKRQDSDSIG